MFSSTARTLRKKPVERFLKLTTAAPADADRAARLCRHCQQTKSNRPRGLCWTCYYTPGIREQHKSTSKFARKDVGAVTMLAPLPDSPTDATPGSEEKILIFIERVRLRQQLFHPLDASDVLPSLSAAMADVRAVA
jgi:hypothetical protein